MRGYDFRRLSAAADGPQSEVWRRFVAIEDLLSSWADVTPVRVVNRPSMMAANGSKPFQAAWLRDLGFRTPETLVTTDPAAAAEFWDRHRQVIYKSVSGIRSVVSRMAESDRGRLPDVAWCPTQFQEFVPGEDIRVHVVGSTTFACHIAASVDDYRYSSGNAELSSFGLPDEVRARCLAVSTAMSLSFCGIDLRRTPDGDWYAFEVNPSPGFSFFEYGTGHRIAEAVADLLVGTE
jgi:glutathione synthase/RimK-type ligase-like ATP-grasp enzyme